MLACSLTLHRSACIADLVLRYTCKLVRLSLPGILCYSSVWRPLAWVCSDPETEAWLYRAWQWHHHRTALVGLAVHGQKLQCVWNAEQRTFTQTRLHQLSAAAQVDVIKCLSSSSSCSSSSSPSSFPLTSSCSCSSPSPSSSSLPSPLPSFSS